MSERPTTKHDIQRDELNTTRLNFAEVTRVFVSGSLSMSYSGVDLGTGDVSLYAQDSIGMYIYSSGTALGTGTSMHFNDGIYGVVSGTIAHVGSYAKAETNANDIFRCTNPGGASAFVGTIATLPGGATLTYNVSSGQEGAMVPASTSQLAKMRLYNTTRGTNALISNCVTGTNTLTLTANVPAGWQVGDTITIASQTVSGGGFSWVDLEMTSGPTNKLYMFINLSFVSTAGDFALLHPLETYAASKQVFVSANVTGQSLSSMFLVKITSNVISLSWTGSPTTTILRESGYLQ